MPYTGTSSVVRIMIVVAIFGVVALIKYNNIETYKLITKNRCLGIYFLLV